MLIGIAYYFIRKSDADIISLLIIPFVLGAALGIASHLRSKDRMFQFMGFANTRR